MGITSKLNVGIIGTGKLGTDLLIKVQRSNYLQCGLFVGRDLNSPGLLKARSLGINISDASIDAFKNSSIKFDLVFDATSAEHHRFHSHYFQSAGIKAIDLTPAKVGKFCVPSIDSDIVTIADNVNMVTCGGQASIPVIHAISQVFSDIYKVEIKSHLAEDSVGPATLANIDDYYASTAMAISAYSGIEDVTVNLQVERSVWKPDMLTIIRAYTENTDVEKLYLPLQERLTEVRKYVPGYHIVGTPSYREGAIEILISIRGLGDWIPSHAGNLDIINCAAIATAERYAKSLGVLPDKSTSNNREPVNGVIGSILDLFGKSHKDVEHI